MFILELIGMRNLLHNIHVSSPNNQWRPLLRLNATSSGHKALKSSADD